MDDTTDKEPNISQIQNDIDTNSDAFQTDGIKMCFFRFIKLQL